jgi:hypothetical protein
MREKKEFFFLNEINKIGRGVHFLAPCGEICTGVHHKHCTYHNYHHHHNHHNHHSRETGT